MRRKLSLLVVLVLGATACGGASAHAATLSATPSNFTSTFSGAQAGDTILLASGNYGTFKGGLKSGWVTIRPQSGASASMSVTFTAASYIHLDGLTMGDTDLSGTQTKHLEISNSTFTGQLVMRTNTLANSDITIDHDSFPSWNKCSGCGEGRVWLPEQTSQPSGITIENNTFGPDGVSDGIQNGSRGTRIINNLFTGLVADPTGKVHTDALQLYGSAQTVISGNYFYDNPDAIMSPDGADHEIIENNVIDAGNEGYPFAITLMADNGSIVRHNTFLGGSCAFNDPCGLLRLGSKVGDPAGRGTVVEDNVMTGITCCSPGPATWSSDHNLVRQSGSVTGPGDQLGTPVFSGGSAPRSMAGFVLAAGSPGRGNASDGTDRGATIDGNAAPVPPPSTATPVDPPTGGGGTSGGGGAATAPVAGGPKAVWTAPTGIRVGHAITLDGTKSTGAGKTCTWDFDGYQQRTGCRISFTFKGTGAKKVTLLVKDSAGRTGSLARTLKVASASAATSAKAVARSSAKKKAKKHAKRRKPGKRKHAR